jgi:TatD DNase family protein
MSPPSPALADTHCHLYLEQFDADRTEVILRAEEAGVARMLVPAIDLETSLAAIRLAEHYPGIYAAVGIHPNSGADWNRDNLLRLRDLAAHPKVVAIGEIGLDYYWDKVARDVQERVFRFQLELAGEMNLPVIIHNREASEDVLRLALNWQSELDEAGSPLAKRPGVLHSYSGGDNQLDELQAANFYIGLAGPVTFKKALGAQAVAGRAESTRLLLETDAPYLAPEPVRGRRNEPGFVAHTALKVSELRGISLEALSASTTSNADTLFEWQN